MYGTLTIACIYFVTYRSLSLVTVTPHTATKSRSKLILIGISDKRQT